MEFDSTHIVSMTSESEHAFLCLVVPDFDAMVITTTDKHGLRVMESDTTNWTIMIFELLNQRLSSIIKQIDCTVVQRCKDPRPVLMEGKALDTLRLGFKFGNHLYI